jgi:glyoxalase/bleomycin resistance protein/dioxygenase superfamily protein
MTMDTLGSTIVVQVGIVVHDIESTSRNWSELFGLPMPEITTTDSVDTARTEYKGASTPARAKLAFFHLGQVDVELIEPIDGPSTWKDQLDERGDSLHHIAFRIKGMLDTLAYLESKDIGLIQRGEYTGGRYAYVDAVDQLGCILELLEND